MTIAAIMQPTYLPWLGYFDLMDQSDVFVFLDSVQFDKRSWQQRNRIKCPNGEQMLTVPVLTKGLFRQKIFEARIDPDSNFADSHIRSIQLNYAKAKYFPQYFGQLEAILKKRQTLLVDLNMDLISWFKEVLGIKAQTIRSSSLNILGKKADLLANICKELNIEHYLSPAGSGGYIGEDNVFDEYGIRLSYQNYEPVLYRQLYGEFIPYLSVLDLLFNEGEQSLAVIRAGRKSDLKKLPEGANKVTEPV
ncbi:MAG: WbqC family protein [Candidatus Omnitrophica bacterium]|nr:WbqC family protein [Candidatus Omnitrophota bacterium]